MKTTGFIFLFCLIFFGTFSFSSKAGESSAVTQERKAEPFHAIEVSTGIDLYLTQGESEKITVEASHDIIDNLKTKVENGVLKIYMEKKIFWKWDITQKVYVTFRDIDMLDASSGSDVESEGTLQLKNMKIEASSGSDIKLTLNADGIEVETSSGSDVSLEGTVNTLEASASSGSDLKTGELKAKHCIVSASSGSDITVYAGESIKARASSGSDIRYLGNPSSKDIDESSGGDVCNR